jgi:RNA polymerase sigma factor (TIGR02999 family)
MEDQEPASVPSDPAQAALDAMVERTYGRVKQIAARMPGVKSGTSISPTVVANETYLKFLRSKNSRELAYREVIGLFVRLMKQILVDLARRRSTEKRGGWQRPAAIGSEIADKLEDPKAGTFCPEDILTVRDAIEKLRITNHRLAEIVEARFYLGLTVDELAKLLEVSVSTVERELGKAFSFLREVIPKRHA